MALAQLRLIRQRVDTREAGQALEKRVEHILRAAGHSKIRRNVFVYDSHGHLSEIDLVYGRWRKFYVECKNYESRPVPLEDVAKFKSVLELNKIPLSRGLFVTTSTFTPRATTIGIKCIDGVQLAAWEKRVRPQRYTRNFIRLVVVAMIAAGAYAFYMDNPETKIVLAEWKRRDAGIQERILYIAQTTYSWMKSSFEHTQSLVQSQYEKHVKPRLKSIK